MILKIWDESGGWVYFDRVERISIFSKGPNEEPVGKEVPTPDRVYGGGVYADLKKKFKVATINRTWGHRAEGEFVEVAFSEGYLLGDDGQTIERL